MFPNPVKLLVALMLLFHCAKCSVCLKSEWIRKTNKVGPKSAKIVDGTGAGEYDHPYMVNIRRNNQHICGGTVLTPFCVLTAAHCLTGVADAELEVFAGNVRLDAAAEHDVVVSKVDQRIVPHSFVEDDTFSQMDVAILMLQSPLEGVNIKPVEIDSIEPVMDGDILSVMGWGTSSFDSSGIQQHLQVANVWGISQESCEKIYMHTPIHVSQDVFCQYVTDDKTICMGDSGGPAMRHGKQVGIASWGVACGRYKHPSAFTSLANDEVAMFLNYYRENSC